MELDIKQIKTLYSTYKIIYQKKVMFNNKEGEGRICPTGGYFKIATNRFSIKSQIQTIMHESLHAITSELTMDLNEKEIESLACSLVKFIQENPEFIKVILEGGD